MKTDDRRLLNFSFAVAGIVVAALVLAGKPTRLMARSSPALSQPEQAQAAQPAEKTAGDVYMNVKVLNNIPSNQLIPAMQYITAALGVECDYCHDTKHFDSDDKPKKLTARKMMTMMFAIDKDNFDGNREVTCYTCHRGAAKPESIPVLSAAMMTGAPAMGASGMMGGANGRGMGMGKPGETGANGSASSAPAISVVAILAKYTDALGGDAAIQKITTLDEKGTAEMPARGGMKTDVEEFRKAPDKAVLSVRLPNGAEMAQGYNGVGGWRAFPRRAAEDLTWDDLARAKQWASFIPGLDLETKEDFVRAQAAGTEKIGDQDAYRVIGFRKGGGRVMFYFDTQSGLLVRVSERIESPLGALPQDTDYADYRDVNGVKLPFSVTVVHVQGPTIYKWDQIQANVAVEDSRFDKPAEKPSQP